MLLNHENISSKMKVVAKPFLKWAGGKGQLINEINNFLPSQIAQGKIQRYIEPFLGGGAVFFYVAQKYPIKEFYLSDINEDLILLYKTVQSYVERLIDELEDLSYIYKSLNSEDKIEFYYCIRTLFNLEKKIVNYDEIQKIWIRRSAQMIFLNRTCYNGLFRVNSRGEFNVPFREYKNPRICDAENLRAVSKVLAKVTLSCGDYSHMVSLSDDNTFIYFDPPYRPISITSSFTSYSRYDFNDKQQKRLALIFQKFDHTGAYLMLSNSDPSTNDLEDKFFEDIYVNYNINRLEATRRINSIPNKRGPIKELLITNYNAG